MVRKATVFPLCAYDTPTHIHSPVGKGKFRLKIFQVVHLGGVYFLKKNLFLWAETFILKGNQILLYIFFGPIFSIILLCIYDYDICNI